MIPKNMFWRKKFFRFLKEESAYGEWVYNVKKKMDETCKSKSSIFNSILNEEDKCESGISGAFVWSTTKPGLSFWKDINNRWLALLGKDKML